MAQRLAALPNLTVTSPLRPKRKLRGSSGERAGKFTLPATGSPRAGTPLCKGDEVHAILEGLMQTEEEKQRVEDEAHLRKKTMVDLEQRVERMLEERDVDAAFEVLRRNLWKATKSHRDNRNSSAASHSETIFKLVLRHSANSRWKFEFTRQRIIPFLCEALTFFANFSL